MLSTLFKLISFIFIFLFIWANKAEASDLYINQSGNNFERTHAKVSGYSSSVGGTYSIQINKKQSIHIDFLREQLKAKLIIHDNDFDINNLTSSFAVKFDLSV